MAFSGEFFAPQTTYLHVYYCDTKKDKPKKRAAIMKQRRYHRHEHKKRELLKNPEVRKAYEEELSMLMIAHRIAELREEANLTQGQLALRLHTKQQVISRLEDEHHIPSFNMLWKVAHAFGKKLEVKLI